MPLFGDVEGGTEGGGSSEGGGVGGRGGAGGGGGGGVEREGERIGGVDYVEVPNRPSERPQVPRTTVPATHSHHSVDDSFAFTAVLPPPF